LKTNKTYGLQKPGSKNKNRINKNKNKFALLKNLVSLKKRRASKQSKQSLIHTIYSGQEQD